MYRQRGFFADFMSKTFVGESGNGLHCNHSIWTTGADGSGSHNAMWDAESTDGLSDVAKYWVAGLLRHAPALTALCCHTISCYRRLHIPWVPDLINWGYHDRMAAMRVHNHGERATYVENR